MTLKTDRNTLKRKIKELEQALDQCRQSQKSAGEAEETARALLNATSESAILINRKGSILAVNEAAVCSLGKLNANIIRMNIEDVLPRDVATQFKQKVDDVIRTGDPIRFENARDGLSYTNTVYPIYDRSGNVEKLAIYAMDITEQKQAEKERLKKEKLLGVLEMAGAACHELNQPLQIVSGYYELFLNEIPEDHPLIENLNIIRDQIERMARITKKIMKITKYRTKPYIKGSMIIDIDKSSDTHA